MPLESITISIDQSSPSVYGKEILWIQYSSIFRRISLYLAITYATVKMRHKIIFIRYTGDLNSEFLFSEDQTAQLYEHIWWKTKWIYVFSGVFSASESETVSFRILTKVIDSISFDKVVLSGCTMFLLLKTCSWHYRSLQPNKPTTCREYLQCFA